MVKKYIQFIFQKYVEPIDPLNIQLIRAFKVLVAVLLGIVVIVTFNVSHPLWIFITTMFVPQMYSGQTKKSCFVNQLIGAGITLVGIMISIYLGLFSIWFAVFISCYTFTAFYIRKYKESSYNRLALLSLIIILISGSVSASSLNFLQNFINVFLGIIISILVSNFLWSFNSYDLLKKKIKKGPFYVSSYVRFVFDDSLRGNFHRLRRYEKKTQILQFIESSYKLKKIQVSDGSNEEIDKNFLHYQEQLFIEVIALSDLLNKPNSEYTLDLIMTELDDLGNYLSDAIENPSSENLSDLKKLISKLDKASPFSYLISS